METLSQTNTQPIMPSNIQALSKHFLLTVIVTNLLCTIMITVAMMFLFRLKTVLESEELAWLSNHYLIGILILLYLPVVWHILIFKASRISTIVALFFPWLFFGAFYVFMVSLAATDSSGGEGLLGLAILLYASGAYAIGHSISTIPLTISFKLGSKLFFILSSIVPVLLLISLSWFTISSRYFMWVEENISDDDLAKADNPLTIKDCEKLKFARTPNWLNYPICKAALDKRNNLLNSRREAVKSFSPSNEALSYFREVAFSPENPTIKQWVGLHDNPIDDIPVVAIGQPDHNDITCMQKAVKELDELIPLSFSFNDWSDSRPGNDPDDNKINLVFLPERQGVRSIGPESGTQTAQHYIGQSHIVIAIEQSPLERCSDVYRGLAISGGLHATGKSHPESILHSSLPKTAGFADIDKEVMRMLYMPGLRIGSTSSQVEEFFAQYVGLFTDDQQPEEGFKEYISDMGFRIDYPAGWHIYPTLGSGPFLGAVQFLPAVSLDVGRWNGGFIISDDIKQQLLSVVGSFPPPPAREEAETNITASLEKLVRKNSPNAKIIESKSLQVNGNEAGSVTYEEGNTKTILVSQLVKYSEYSGLDPVGIVISYSAKGGYFDPTVMNRALTSFRGSVLQKYVNDLDSKEMQEMQEVEQYLSKNQDVKLPGYTAYRRQADLERESLNIFYECPDGEKGFRVQKAALTVIGSFEQYLETLRARNGNASIKEVDINGVGAYLALVESGAPDTLTWTTNSLWIDISNFCENLTAEQLLEIARKLEY